MVFAIWRPKYFPTWNQEMSKISVKTSKFGLCESKKKTAKGHSISQNCVY